jgi:hypothetical protein
MWSGCIDGTVRTGNATDIDVASNAAMSVIIHKLPKAARKRHPGLNTSGAGAVVLPGFSESSNGSGAGEGEGEEGGDIEEATLSSPRDCDEGVAMVSVSWLRNTVRGSDVGLNLQTIRWVRG